MSNYVLVFVNCELLLSQQNIVTGIPFFKARINSISPTHIKRSSNSAILDVSHLILF